MQAIATQLAKLLSILWRGVVMVLLAVVAVISIPLTLIFLPLRKLVSGQSDAVDPSAMEEFERAMEAIKSGDTGALDRLATEIEGFPKGHDRFLALPWLTNALGEGAPEAVRWMLDQGVPVNYEDDEGYTPLQTAISRGDGTVPDLLQILIEAGADVTGMGSLNLTALHIAAAEGSDEAVSILIEHGADPTAKTTDPIPAQPADLAERAGHGDLAQRLRELAASAD